MGERQTDREEGKEDLEDKMGEGCKVLEARRGRAEGEILRGREIAGRDAAGGGDANETEGRGHRQWR